MHLKRLRRQSADPQSVIRMIPPTAVYLGWRLFVAQREACSDDNGHKEPQKRLRRERVSVQYLNDIEAPLLASSPYYVHATRGTEAALSQIVCI
jgi:hypothetical protein